VLQDPWVKQACLVWLDRKAGRVSREDPAYLDLLVHPATGDHQGTCHK